MFDTDTSYLPWMDDALCAQIGPNDPLFFPGKGGSTREAKRFCNQGCEVVEACLQYAIDEEIEEGIWGGKSGRERKRLRKLQQT